MTIRIVPYEAKYDDAVAAFNERGRGHKAPFPLCVSALEEWLPKRDGRTVFREYFLALDGDDVRGGFILRRQPFWLLGEVRDAANYQGPISEGIWDRRWMMAGVQMLRAALREEPLLYALGMGGMEQPLPRALAAAGWSLAPVPFRFLVIRPKAFLRNIQPLRRTPVRAWLADCAAASGLGTLGILALQHVRASGRLSSDCECVCVTEFGPWADEIWAQTRSDCLFCAVRDRVSQNILFGDGNPNNITLRCSRGGRDIGWCVIRSTRMRGNKYFGNMQVGSIVDVFALPGQEIVVLQLAKERLRALGSDIIVTNQTHRRWLEALGQIGFLEAPSNFIFAASPELSERIGPLATALPRLHFNRADGDGPIHI